MHRTGNLHTLLTSHDKTDKHVLGRLISCLHPAQLHEVPPSMQCASGPAINCASTPSDGFLESRIQLKVAAAVQRGVVILLRDGVDFISH